MKTIIIDGIEYNLTPKVLFKKGDFVVIQETTYQITEVENLNVTLSLNGRECLFDIDVLKNARLWDITKDAKDGDVLSDGTTIFIFKDLLSDGSVMSYCDYDTDSGESDAFYPLSMNLMCSKINPAAKEQRDTLERAMANAGYTFDFEKKELKKIHVIDEGKAEMDYCFTKMMNGEKVSSAWSEEDEKIFRALSNALVRISSNTRTDSTSINYTFFTEINWLKSLKERMKGE